MGMYSNITVHLSQKHSSKLLIMQPARRTSQWVKTVDVLSLIDGVVHVTTKTGDEYIYRGVSRRAIINLCLNDRMSLGFWVNTNCIAPERTSTVKLGRFSYV